MPIFSNGQLYLSSSERPFTMSTVRREGNRLFLNDAICWILKCANKVNQQDYLNLIEIQSCNNRHILKRALKRRTLNLQSLSSYTLIDISL